VLRSIDNTILEVLMETSTPDFIMKMNLIKQKVHWQRKVAKLKVDYSITFLSHRRNWIAMFHSSKSLFFLNI